MVRRVLAAVLVCAGIALWTGCVGTVDCEYCCSLEGYSVGCHTSAKIDEADCNDCDFPAVNIYKNSGYVCTCSEK